MAICESVQVLDTQSITVACFQAVCFFDRVPVAVQRDAREMYAAIPANHEL